MQFMPIEIDIQQQRLTYTQDGRSVLTYPVSTAKRGCGERKNSFQTPRGDHCIRAKIGAGVPSHTVFVGRRPTGELFTPALSAHFPERDWILSRILWLSGLEPGKNRLGDVDTMQRYIYIHGTSDEALIGQPVSHGCIRMRNRDIIVLFERVEIGELVRLW